jgi:hypothetical protein
MASIPLSSFLASAATVMTGSLLGKAQGEAALAQQQAQDEAAKQEKAQQQQQQLNWQAEQVRLNAAQAETAKYHGEEDANRQAELARQNRATDAGIRRGQESFDLRGKLAGARNAGQAYNIAEENIRGLQAQFHALDPQKLSPQDYKQQQQDLIDQIGNWQDKADQYQQMQFGAAGIGAPPLPGAGPAPGVAAPAPGTASPGVVPPAPAPAKRSTLHVAMGTSPKLLQVAAAGKRADRRLTDTEAKELSLKAVRAQRLADAATNRKDKEAYQRQVLYWKGRSEGRQERKERFQEAHPRGLKANTAAATQANKILATIQNPKKWESLDPQVKGSLARQYEKIIGKNIDPEMKKYLDRTANLPAAAGGKGGLTAQEKYDRTQALRSLREKAPGVLGQQGLLAHDPTDPKELPVRATWFNTAYTNSDHQGRLNLQRSQPEDFAYWQRQQPKAPEAPDRSPAAPTQAAAPQRVVATAAAATQPPTRRPAAAQTTATPQRSPARLATPTAATPQGFTGYVHNLPAPVGVKPQVWNTLRHMPVPFNPQTEAQHFRIYNYMVGEGITPAQMRAEAAKSTNPGIREAVDRIVSEIESKYLSGKALALRTLIKRPDLAARYPKLRQALFSDQPGANVNPQVKFAPNAQPGWHGIPFPKGVTAVWGLGGNKGIMREKNGSGGVESRNFEIRNGTVKDMGPRYASPSGF